MAYAIQKGDDCGHAIVAPALGPNAGIAGAILLAQAARAENS